MKKYLIILLICLISFSAFSQSAKEINRAYSCQSKWEYINVIKSFNGTIIFYLQPIAYCGVISNASVTLIKSDQGDTLRILNLCDNQSDRKVAEKFKIGDKVIVQTESSSFSADEIPYDPLSCKIKKTFFGSMKKK